MRFTSIALLLGISAITGAHADVNNFKPVAAIDLEQRDEVCTASTVTKKETVTVTAGASPTQASKLPSNAQIVTTPVVGSLTLGNADGEPVVVPVLQNRTLTILEAPKTKSAKDTKTVTVTNGAECEATGGTAAGGAKQPSKSSKGTQPKSSGSSSGNSANSANAGNNNENDDNNDTNEQSGASGSGSGKGPKPVSYTHL